MEVKQLQEQVRELMDDRKSHEQTRTVEIIIQTKGGEFPRRGYLRKLRPAGWNFSLLLDTRSFKER